MRASSLIYVLPAKKTKKGKIAMGMYSACLPQVTFSSFLWDRTLMKGKILSCDHERRKEGWPVVQTSLSFSLMGFTFLTGPWVKRRKGRCLDQACPLSLLNPAGWHIINMPAGKKRQRPYLSFFTLMSLLASFLSLYLFTCLASNKTSIRKKDKIQWGKVLDRPVSIISWHWWPVDLSSTAWSVFYFFMSSSWWNKRRPADERDYV